MRAFQARWRSKLRLLSPGGYRNEGIGLMLAQTARRQYCLTDGYFSQITPSPSLALGTIQVRNPRMPPLLLWREVSPAAWAASQELYDFIVGVERICNCAGLVRSRPWCRPWDRIRLPRGLGSRRP